MPRSIQRRPALSQNRQQLSRESQVVPEAAEQDRFEAIVPFYHQRVLESLDAETAASLDSDDLTDVVLQLLRQLETAADAPSMGGVHQALARRIVDEMRGLGPLGPLLRDPDISDILVNGMHSVYVEKHGVLSRIDVRFRDFDHLTRLAQRIVTLEDAAELKLQQPHVVRLESRAPSAEGGGEISMRDLLKNALRMRPDRIVVGEVRGAEALEAMQAMNTGHPGSMVTVHANSSRDAISRLEYLVMMGSGEMPLSAIRNQVISAVDLVVHASRFSDGKRRVVAITDVVGLEGDVAVLEDIWSYDPGSDRFACSGSRPSFAGRVEDAGFGDLLNSSMSASPAGMGDRLAMSRMPEGNIMLSMREVGCGWAFRRCAPGAAA